MLRDEFRGQHLKLLSGTYEIPHKYVIRKLSVLKNGFTA